MTVTQPCPDENVPSVSENEEKEKLNSNRVEPIELKDGKNRRNISNCNTFEWETDPDTLCGIGGFHPRWIQGWATPKTYLGLYSIIGVIEGIFYFYRIGVITTLEKRFAFKSKISGAIMMMEEISPIFLGVQIGYLGGKTHRPRMFGMGMLCTAICCFLYAFPFFVYGPASHLTSLAIKNGTKFEMCLAEGAGQQCEDDDRPPTMTAVYLFFLGGLLRGLGNTAINSIGMSYLDDNAKKKNTAMYFAISYSMKLVGPMLGYLLASLFLKYPENPLSEPKFALEDPRWIGAWWVGFAFQGVMLTLFALPLFIFPRRLPGQKKQEVTKISWTDLWAATKRLLVNPVYMAVSLIACLQFFGTVGHSIMLPKYMEQQFRLSASDASLFSGPPGVACVMVSTVIGGYFVWIFKPRAKMLIGIMISMEMLTAIGYLLLMIPKCEEMNMQNFGMNSDGLILEGPCNSYCNCSTRTFTPMCGADLQSLYFSPCFAGCTGDPSSRTFTNCSCALDAAGTNRSEVIGGFCVLEDCWLQALAYIITYPTLQFFYNLLRVQYTVILLRSVKTEDKSTALGFFETLTCIFGVIPFLLIFGALVDTSCLVWEQSCGETGNCWFYDTDLLNTLVHSLSAGFTFMAVLSLFVPFCLSDRLGDVYAEDDDVTEVAEAGTEEAPPDATTQFLS